MAGLQNIQPPLGMMFPGSRSRGRQLSSFQTNEALLMNNEALSNNCPSGESILVSLKRIHTDNLVLFHLGMPTTDASTIQDVLQSRQPEVVFLHVHDATMERTSTTPVIERREASELRWMREHQREIAQWRGQWLLIAENRLLGHSASFRDIRDAIARHNLTSPFTYYVPTEEESPFVLL
jgi:hypothetical protein